MACSREWESLLKRFAIKLVLIFFQLLSCEYRIQLNRLSRNTEIEMSISIISISVKNKDFLKVFEVPGMAAQRNMYGLNIPYLDCSS